MLVMKIDIGIDEQLLKRQYKPDYKPLEEQKIITIGGKLVATLENIIVFSGLPKAGKSSFLSAAVASAFVPYSIFSIATFLPEKRKSICYIDTESSEWDFYRVIERIKATIPQKKMPKTFTGYTMRDLGANEIKEYLEYYLSIHPEVSIVYIDGLLDLLTDYNDVSESRQLINWLKKITAVYKVLIVGVVHTGKKDNNTLGHFGSMIDRYCQSVLTVEKNSKEMTFELSAKFMRSDSDFDKVILANENGVFRQVN